MGKQLSQQEFLNKAKLVHGDLFDYTKTVYEKSCKKVVVICKVHGDFLVTPNKHLGGGGCPICANNSRKTVEHFFSQAIDVHGTTYDYSRVQYTNTNSKVEIVCPVHGSFLQTPKKHLSGQGCEKCGRKKTGEAKTVPFEEFVRQAKIAHDNRYEYLKETYINFSSKVGVVCKKHGIFYTQANDHVLRNVHGCEKCYREVRKERDELTMFPNFLKRAFKIHGDLYDYSKVVYKGAKERVEILCKEHGSFYQTPHVHTYDKCGCPSCSHTISKAQVELEEYIHSLDVKTIRNHSLSNGKEIDIFCPDLKIGFEYNGLYWHTDQYRPKFYHSEKTSAAAAEGIRLVHIFEDEWVRSQDKCKAWIRSIVGKETLKFDARKGEVREISAKIAADFLTKTHMQGPGAQPVYAIGLFIGNELVSVMTFINTRQPEEIELIRFSSVGIVRGGFTKLLSYFIERYGNLYNTIISFSEKRWSQGSIYRSSGFTWLYTTRPSYWWVLREVRLHRRGFQKQYLERKWTDYDSSLTEVENCNNHGYYQIWDCGKDKWILKLR
jgi:hypothetical protein